MPLYRITPPTVLPVSLEDMKLHSRVDGAAQDALMSMFIRTAVERLDGRDGLIGRCLITQAWRLTLDGFPPEIVLPLPPCQAVLSITYLDPAGAPQLLAPSAYDVFGLGAADQARIRPSLGAMFPASLRCPESVTVEFRAGYGDAPEDVPEPLRTAIRMHAAHLFEHRESVSMGSFMEVPQSYHDLVSSYRLWSF